MSAWPCGSGYTSAAHCANRRAHGARPRLYGLEHDGCRCPREVCRVKTGVGRRIAGAVWDRFGPALREAAQAGPDALLISVAAPEPSREAPPKGPWFIQDAVRRGAVEDL